jgi:activator of HSP90 ATPase
MAALQPLLVVTPALNRERVQAFENGAWPDSFAGGDMLSSVVEMLTKGLMMSSKEIRHVVRIAAPPEAIYRALMNSRAHSAFTGAPAKIDPKVGGRFTAWGSHLEGINVDLIKNKRIVQAWRAANWPDGHYSIATFELRHVKNATTIVFRQSGIPAKNAKSINEGWKTHYWQPLKLYFTKPRK